MRLISAARAEYRALVDHARLALATKPGAPTPSLPSGLCHGTHVVVYRETTKSWEPAVFLYESGPMVFVRYNREVQPFPRERVKVTVPGLDYGSNNGPLSWLTIPAPDKTSPAIPLQPLENMVSSTVLDEE